MSQLTAKQIETAIKAADRLYVKGHRKQDHDFVKAAEVMIENIYNAIDSTPGVRGLWSQITPITHEILSSHGYDDEMPLHEGWD